MSLRVVTVSESLGEPALERSTWNPSPMVVESVASVIEDVRERGDAALVEYTRSLDDSHYDLSRLRVPIPMHDGARALVPPEIADALRLVKERIARFQERQRQADLTYVDEDGSRYALRYRPLGSVAIYVVGGSSASAVLQAAVPARIAGVSRTIVLAQPQSDGSVHPAVRFACALCEVDELYAVGGAHAIAAAAYGTESIVRVEKIVGSGPGVVAEAKRQVYGACEIDGLGTPPEVLVVADDDANSELVAGELLAQAERDPYARVAVVSESRALLEAVAQLLDSLEVGTLARGDVIESVIANSAFLVHAATRDELSSFVETFAPARLALHVRDAEPYLARLRRAGVVFVGDLTPVAAGAYVGGVNALTLADFQRRHGVLENSRERMDRDVQPLAALAEYEGLPQHAQSARMRGGG